MFFVQLLDGPRLESKAMSQNQAKKDPYLWLLGISPTEERTHYRLLDIPNFESDLDVIEVGRNRRNASLRQIKDGPYLKDAERIKEEIAKSFRLLCNQEEKATYDARLREKLQSAESKSALTAFEDVPKFSAEIHEQQIQQYRDAVREVFADGIVKEHEKRYLQQLYPKLGISADEAVQIFGEIEKETQERKQRIQQFRDAVREVFADGIVEEHEMRHLQQLYPKLGISADEAVQIFGEIEKETQERKQRIQQFRDAVREVLADGIVKEHENRHLQQLYPKLGIDADEARQIFGEIAKETQERTRQEETNQILQRNLGGKMRFTVRSPLAEQERIQREQDNKTSIQQNRRTQDSELVIAQPVPRMERSPSTAQGQLPPPRSRHVDGQLQPPSISTARQDLHALAKSKVIAPAIGLVACSLLSMFFTGIGMLGIASSGETHSGPERLFLLGFYGVILLTHVFLLFGSFSMYKLDSLSLARWTCGLSIPLNMCCFFIGPIFGIWGLIVLANKDVNSCFRRQ